MILENEKQMRDVNFNNMNDKLNTSLPEMIWSDM